MDSLSANNLLLSVLTTDELEYKIITGDYCIIIMIFSDGPDFDINEQVGI